MRILHFAKVGVAACCMMVPLAAVSGEQQDPAAVDTKLLAQYECMLEELRYDLRPKIPSLEDHAQVASILASDALDAQLVTHAVLVESTPEGLASFARQSKAHERLITQLLADTELMQQMLVADGPRTKPDGPAFFGQAMEVYTNIQKASPKAREGVLQRLAVAIALERRGQDPVQRYLHFEKAYLDGELDPGFPTLDTWNLRFVVNGNEGVDELAWGREMLRNYRPDHIYTQNRRSRYTRIVNTNVEYGSQRQRDDRPELTGYQNILMNGGICGRRAFFGQFICRAFGVPVIKRPSRGHGALARWTPEGWVVNLGPRWGSGWTDTLYHNDKAFHASSQARRRADAYLQVARAQWIGLVMGEQRVYGGAGDRKSWNGVALLTQQRIIKESKAVEIGPEGEEFGEADDLTIAEGLLASEIDEDDRKIHYLADGTIEIPVAAYHEVGAKPERFSVMRSFDGGLQAYLGPFGRKGSNVLRGGSHTSSADGCSSYRRIRSAGLGRYPNWGMRVALTPPAGQKPVPELTIDLGHGVTMEFVYIKPGTFVMGGYRERGGRFDCVEVPKREVEITKGYYLGKTEVTEAQFHVLGDNPEAVESIPNPTHPKGLLAINGAEWFCRAATKKTGYAVRLPTEAEWEFAARAGTDTDWFFGNDPAKLGAYAWFKDNARKSLQPVARKQPNPWGLYDMYGNVWEWVADIYEEDYFAKAPRKDPTGPAGRGPQSQIAFTIRVPQAGAYALTARVVTMNYDQTLDVATQASADMVRMTLPFTKGMWQDSEPVIVILQQGENTLAFSRRDPPQYGVALKSFTLKPAAK